MKTITVVLIGLVWLTACSPAPSPIQAKSTPISQPTKGFPSFPTTNLASTNTSAALPAAPTSTTLLQEIRDLSNQRRTDLVPAAAGWLHIVTRQFHSKDSLTSAWDNSSGQYQQEDWLSLDRQGQVLADIRRVVDDNGQSDELGLLTGGVWKSVAMAQQNSDRNTLPFDPNYGVYEQFAALVSQGLTINKSTLYKECWYQGEKYTITNGQVTHEVLFRPDHEALRWIKTWQVSAGNITLIDSIEVALEERLPNPPDDVLALVAQANP